MKQQDFYPGLARLLSTLVLPWSNKTSLYPGLARLLPTLVLQDFSLPWSCKTSLYPGLAMEQQDFSLSWP